MHVAFIGLGSNLGDRKKNIAAALVELSALGAARISSIYETAPLPPAEPGDPSFLNCVVGLKTKLSLGQLAKACKKIYKKLGGRKRAKGAPRKIDLDILLYDGAGEKKAGGVSVPHQRMLERKFVLLPLRELAPKLKIKGKPLDYYLRKVSKQKVKRL